MDTQPTKRKKKEDGEEEALRGGNVRTPLACLLLPHSTIQHMTATDCGDLTTPQLLDAVCAALPKEEVYDARPVSHTAPPFRYCLSRCPADQFGFLGRRMVVYPHDFEKDPPPRYRYWQLTPPFVLHQDIYDMSENMVVPQYTLHVAVDTLSNIFEDPPPNPRETDDNGALDTNNEYFKDEIESQNRSESQQDDESSENSCCSCSSSASCWCNEIPSRCYNAIKDIVNDFGRGMEVELTHLFGNIEYDHETEDLCCFPLFGTQRIVPPRSGHVDGREEDSGGWRLHLSVESAGIERPLVDIAFNVPPSDISRSFGVRRWEHKLVVETFNLSNELRQFLSYFDNVRNLCTDENTVLRFIPRNFLRSARCDAVTLSKSWSTVQVVSCHCFAEMATLTSLDMDCCAENLTVILQSFCDRSTLRKVDLRRFSKLSIIQTAFTHCQDLRVLHLPPNLAELLSLGNGSRLNALKTTTSSSIVVFGGLNEALSASSKPSGCEDQLEEVCSLNFVKLQRLDLSFCKCMFLTKLDLSGSASHLESIDYIGCGCPSLHTVILGDLPKLECIGGSFFMDCPSLTRVDLGSAPLLRRMKGCALRNTKLLDFDMLKFQRSRNSENRHIFGECYQNTSTDRMISIPFLKGSRTAETMDWIELLKIMHVESLPFLWYSYLHHWNNESKELHPLDNLIVTALSFVELKMPPENNEGVQQETFRALFSLWKILVSLGAIAQNDAVSNSTARCVYTSLARCSTLMVRVWDIPEDKHKFGLGLIPIALSRKDYMYFFWREISPGPKQQASFFEHVAGVLRSCRLFLGSEPEVSVDSCTPQGNVNVEIESLKIADDLFRIVASRCRSEKIDVDMPNSSSTEMELEKSVREMLQCPHDKEIIKWIPVSSTVWEVFWEMNDQVVKDKANNHVTFDLMELASRIGPK